MESIRSCSISSVTTHNGTFHADEVTAIALLHIFRGVDYTNVKRVPHQTLEFDDGYVLDIGRTYNPDKLLFDHHQSKELPSSAGLVWKYLGLADNFPKISSLVKAVDDNDIGVKPAEEFEYSRLLSTFNSDDVHSGTQYTAFIKAIEFAIAILTNLQRAQVQLDFTAKTIKQAKLFEGTDDVLDLGTWLQGWGSHVNGETMPNIEAVHWYDEELDTYNIQTTNAKAGSYDKVGKSLLPDPTMEFVHVAGFFAVAKTKDIMVKYIANSRK